MTYEGNVPILSTMRCVVFIVILLISGAFTRGETVTVHELSPNTDLAVALSNAPNHSLIRIPSGVYSVIPSKVISNGLGGINIFNKTNLTIEGVPGGTIIDGTSALGALLYLTNSSRVTIRGLTFQGLVVTNYALAAGIGHVWATLPVYAVDNLTIENCQFIDGHDHGIHDMGAQKNWNTISTNNILIRSNYFDNFGSARSNEVISTDGTAIVPTGWTVEANEFRNCLRCVEPYSENDATPNPFFNCIIRSNRMINTLDSAILTAGSTNGNRLLIEGNYIYNDPGYSRRGSNMFPGYGIALNDGHGHVIRGNQIINPAYTGIVIGGSPYHTTGILIESNTIENADARDQGFGILAIAEGVAEVRDLIIRDNTISRTKNYSIFLLSTRDSIVTRNTISNPTATGGPAIKLGTTSGSSNVNVLISSNIISDSTSKMTFGIEVTTNNHTVRVVENCIVGARLGVLGNYAGDAVVYQNRGLNCPPTPIDIRINEWLAYNSGMIFDPTDHDPESCFELHNAEQFAVDLSGYFLTDSASEPLKFSVPNLDQSIIPPGGYLTIWADNEPHQNSSSTKDLHANFILNPAGGAIELRGADASVIDSIVYGKQFSNVSEGLNPGNYLERIHMSSLSFGEENRINGNPTIVATEVSGSTVVITFISKRSEQYQIESSSSPGDSQWAAVGEPIVPVSSLTRITNDLPPSTSQFFRVAALP